MVGRREEVIELEWRWDMDGRWRVSMASAENQKKFKCDLGFDLGIDEE